ERTGSRELPVCDCPAAYAAQTAQVRAGQDGGRSGDPAAALHAQRRPPRGGQPTVDRGGDDCRAGRSFQGARLGMTPNQTRQQRKCGAVCCSPCGTETNQLLVTEEEVRRCDQTGVFSVWEPSSCWRAATTSPSGAAPAPPRSTCRG